MLKRIISLTLCVCMLWSSTVLVAGAEGLVDGENAAQAADDAPLCDKCSASLDENGAVVHAADCPNAPKTEEPPADSGPKVGDQIWIKRGVDIYKDYTNESETPHNTKAAYQITIEEVILGTDNVPAWYRFSFAGLSGIIGSVFLRGYQYVRVENTSVEEPTEPTEPPVTPGHEVTTEKGDTVTAEGLPETAVLAAGEPAQEAMTALRGFAAEQEEPFGKALRERNRKVGEKGFAAEQEEPFGKELFAYDLTVQTDEGSPWQPEDGPVRVTLTIPGMEVGEYESVRVAHLHDGTVELLETDFNRTAHTVTFLTEGFSVFFGYTVDFEYHGYQYSLEGGSDLWLSELMEALGLSQSVADVADVAFSDPALLEISEQDEDWLLTSLAAFTTREYLTITFLDGSQLEILVTDPITRYYLPGTNWCDEGLSQITLEGGEHKVNPTAIPTTSGDIAIYARPGMALKFDTNSYSQFGEWTGNSHKTGPFTWVYDTDNHVQYYIIDSGDSHKTASFKLYDTADPDNRTTKCTVTVSIIPENEAPTLVEDTLTADSQFAIATLPVTLYNYDGWQFNQYYYKKQRSGWLAFRSSSLGKSANTTGTSWTSAYLPNAGTAAYCTMGIMQNTLDPVTHLPRLGSTNQTDLFSTDTLGGAKKVYENVGFQFIYDKTTGYYTYSSNLNHAQLFEEENKIKLYNETLAPQYLSVGDQGCAGFHPFSDINRAFSDKSNQRNQNNANRTKMWNDNSGAYLASDYFNNFAQYAMDPVSTTSATSKVDMHFGLQVAAPFYWPEGGQIEVNGEKQDLTYTFTGDDDLWVYIDDQLVLDLGGGHYPTSGTINLAKKTVSLDKFRNQGYSKIVWTGNECVASEIGRGPKTWRFDELGIPDFGENQMHTLRIFYLERFSGESNCRMRFNLPIGPSGKATISKTVTDENGAPLAVTPDIAYTFQALYTDAIHTNPEPLKNQKIWIAGAKTTTDANGCFQLKHGQTAVILDIPQMAVDAKVYVVEKTPETDAQYAYVGSTVKINDVEQPQPYEFDALTAFASVNEEKMSFDFTNRVKLRTGNLTIVKGGIDDSDNHSASGANKKETQSTLYHISGSVQSENDFSMDVAIPGNGSVTIQNLPVGTYTVTEKTNWSWRYTLKDIAAQTDTQAVREKNSIYFALTEDGETVTFTNARSNPYWLSGDCYAANQWDSDNNVRRVS
jgi:fibro-slime domain-containing protein